MKYSNILLSLLATVTVQINASPVPDNSDITARGADDFVETPEYEVRDEELDLDLYPEEYEEINELATRGPDDSPEFNHFAAKHPGMVTGKYYAFEMMWPRGTLGGETGEDGKDLAAVRDVLKFDHIALVIGQVTETSTGPPKNRKTKRSFNPRRYHLVKKAGNKNGIDFDNWSYTGRDKDRPFNFIKEVTKAKYDSLRTNADAWKAANPNYDAKKANCNHFVTYMKNKI